MPTSIVINNASFEQNSANGWTTSGSGGVYDPTQPYVPYSSMDGDIIYYFSSIGASISQTLGQTYDSNEQYTFSVDIGDPNYSGSQSYTYNLYAGSTLIGTVSGNTGNNDTLETVTITSGVPDSNLNGETLRIELIKTGGSGELWADNVQGSFISLGPDGTVDGTAGDDTLGIGYVDGEGDIIDGADGLDDVIVTGDGNDIINAGFGNDLIDAGNGNDTVIAGDGNDTIQGGEGDDTLYGGLGNDVLIGDEPVAALVPLAGTFAYSYAQTTDGYQSEHFGDLGTGSVDDPELLFDGDPDTELRLHENDVLELSFGQELAAGTSISLIEGSGGEDGYVWVYVSFGSTDPNGDTLSASGNGVGHANITGGQSELVYEGLSNADVIFNLPIDATHIQFVSDATHGGWGEAELTEFVGGGPPPVIGTFDDTIFGGDGDDFIDGGQGDDGLDGGAGNDTFAVSTGTDTISGGTGIDTYDATGTTAPSGDVSTNPDEVVSVTVSSSGVDDTGPNFGSGSAIKINDGATDTFTGLETFIGGDGIISGEAASGSIDIVNAGFEDTGGDTSSDTWGTVTGWDLGGSDGGIYDVDPSEIGNATGDNIGYVGANEKDSVSQVLTHQYNSNEVYEFSVDIGDPTDYGAQDYEVNLYAGTQLIGTVSGNTGNTDTLSTKTVTSTLVDPGLDGQFLKIEIVKTTGGQYLYFDNVQGSFINNNPLVAQEDIITIENAVRPEDVLGVNDSAVGTFAPDGGGAVIAFGGAGEPTISEILNGPFSGAVGSWQITSGDESGTIGGISFENFEEINFDVMCFVAGTLIKTKNGEVPIEQLKSHDLVLTLDYGYQPIRWIGSTKVGSKQLLAKPKLKPICIRANSLQKNIPAKDLLVSRQHRIFVRSLIAKRLFDSEEVLVAAHNLLEVDGIDIATEVETVEYWHLLFDRHQIVCSNGAWTESLFTGPEALKALSQEAREEIKTLFPDITDPDFIPVSARSIPKKGKTLKQLALRHQKNFKPLFGLFPESLTSSLQC
jgi:hypothetical protein